MAMDRRTASQILRLPAGFILSPNSKSDLIRYRTAQMRLTPNNRARIDEAFNFLLNLISNRNEEREEPEECRRCKRETLPSLLTRTSKICKSCVEQKYLGIAVREIETVLRNKNLWEEADEDRLDTPWKKHLKQKGVYSSYHDFENNEEVIDYNWKNYLGKDFAEFMSFTGTTSALATKIKNSVERRKNELLAAINSYQGSSEDSPEVKAAIQKLVRVVNQAKLANNNNATLTEIQTAIDSLREFFHADSQSATRATKEAWRKNTEAQTILAELQSKKNKKEGGGGSDSSVDTAVKEAIREIENCLRPIEKANIDEVLGKNWKQKFGNKDNLKQVRDVKENFLDKIADYRLKKGRSGSNFANLWAEKNTAISKIGQTLLQDPKINTSELENTNQNWENDIQNATSETQINQIKSRVLTDIASKRNKKTLEIFRNQVIQQIKNELTTEPQIKDNELNKPNWENEMKNLSDKSKIEYLRDEVLADISNKKLAKEEENKITNLLSQAKSATTYEELETILKQIKLLRSSNSYKLHEKEIEEQEARLRNLDPEKYQDTVNQSLDDQLKNNGLSDEDVSDQTKKALEDAKKDGDPEKVKAAEEAVAKEGAEKKLDNILKLAKKATTLEEKKQLLEELLKFVVNDNDYQSAAYQARKSEVDNMLAELRGENQSKENPHDPFPYRKFIFWGGIGIGLIIISLVIWKKSRSLKK